MSNVNSKGSGKNPAMKAKHKGEMKLSKDTGPKATNSLGKWSNTMLSPGPKACSYGGSDAKTSYKG